MKKEARVFTSGRVREFVATHADTVFIRSEFEVLGGKRQVSRVLAAMVIEGTLVKLGLGVFAKAKVSVLSGRPIPFQPLEVLAPLALAKLGISVRDAPLVALYNSGKSHQIPAGVAFDTGRKRVTRRLGFNGKFVELLQTNNQFSDEYKSQHQGPTAGRR